MNRLTLALREILVSLMGSTTPCASHFAHSFSREALAAHEATCPTVTHALVPELYSALDPDFLTIQARRKCFNLDLFTILGEAIKVHCAPVRDALVNSMVETAFRGDIAGSLRKCFDCVEVMKLVSFTPHSPTDARTLQTTKCTRSDHSSGKPLPATSSARSGPT